ncbi:hypothetical protein [Aquamicrobium zhengzhouense]|uniref:Uncharacterized protein n=1 Tax=Aquamicrobium zhengzhouense TaxID=2781738 RepID=A0ABS0SAR9_9HYPH|nr:hypothetical protein [Aquamicrobium zhengzhouense]MBI1620347.1 hypothetical protein [Aquamicrobium zhengzhouense]
MSASGWLGFAVIAGGLAVTNPTVEEIELELRQQVIMAITSSSISANDDAATTILMGMCKFSAEECYNVLRMTMRLQMNDYLIGKAVVIHAADGSPTNCVGAVKRLWCPKFLNSTK